ncbi:hypothetical protein Fmac_026906 [Flemingia macrophylla]|uniref:Uncharacterized protein n=1 Tax=Flemingia macrophylla TaxID=520843 RepID=A0ABD1LG56_9FABA
MKYIANNVFPIHTNKKLEGIVDKRLHRYVVMAIMGDKVKSEKNSFENTMIDGKTPDSKVLRLASLACKN